MTKNLRCCQKATAQIRDQLSGVTCGPSQQPQGHDMTIEEAEELLQQIADLANEVEEDEELMQLDQRYAILAKWIDTDVGSVRL